MTVIHYEHDDVRAALEGQTVAVVGYGNQGRPWALNLRDSGADVRVCVRNDETRDTARVDGFDAAELEAANECDVLCLLVPDDAIPSLPLDPTPDACVVVASGYTLAFGRIDPDCDAVMVAPRMLGPEVRASYEEGVGFITAVGVHRDATGRAQARMLAVASAIGGLRQGAIELTPHQEAVLDLAVEQALAPGLQQVTRTFVEVMDGRGIPIEAILTELYLSGEVERNYRLLRTEGYAAQLEHHSPASQYGQLSRVPRFAEVDVRTPMAAIVDQIADGSFADEWEAERDAGFTTLAELKEAAAGELIKAFEDDLRRRLGTGAQPPA